MTNPKCPFCATLAKDHEAGRCLDHWIEVVKTNKIPDRKFKYTGLSTDKYGKFYYTFRGEKYELYDEHNYSEDLNDAITLWQVDTKCSWHLSFDIEKDEWITEVYFLSKNKHSYVHIVAKTSALAIGRTFLIINLEGDNNG